jgi:hypothetical protein
MLEVLQREWQAKASNEQKRQSLRGYEPGARARGCSKMKSRQDIDVGQKCAACCCRPSPDTKCMLWIMPCT